MHKTWKKRKFAKSLHSTDVSAANKNKLIAKVRNRIYETITRTNCSVLYVRYSNLKLIIYALFSAGAYEYFCTFTFPPGTHYMRINKLCTVKLIMYNVQYLFLWHAMIITLLCIKGNLSKKREFISHF